MNKSLRHLVICLATWLVATAALLAENPSSEGAAAPIKKLTPGLLWRVEVLPESQRTRLQTPPPATRGERSEASKETSSTKIVEENWIGENFRKQILKRENANDEIRYSVAGLILVQKTKDEFFMTTPSDDGEVRPLPVDRLEGFEWIKPQRFAGMAVVDGERCAIYLAPWRLTPDQNSAADTVPTGGAKVLLAAISVTDHLPRRLEDPLSIRRYRFAQSANPPALPPEVQAARQKLQNDLRKELRRYQIPQ